MATMIPGGIEEFKTEGERRFYRFLESVAKPDHEFTTWYLIGTEPEPSETYDKDEERSTPEGAL